ncbi:hypothetical protein SAMN04487910_4606 [Aquimarina amphilecti]|uniref:Uncharacterized protein n=1 Tax=Aquimarina amphilecti TaxID=1038014 RepID=A0A1H7WZX5_AQUAM|nr:hypothetical protein [Aquimarina amphilecti]SEM27140.1 hypothetical protein SAMN04487910_4606 [Aquimarina amphilecti]
MSQENNNPRKNWDFMIGIALVLFGSFRLYQRTRIDFEWDYKIFLTISFIVYGGFLVYRHLQNKDINED